MIQHVSMINQLKVFFHLFVLQVTKVVKANYTNTWIHGLDLEKVECL
jgi:hypothetical protein